MKCVYLTIPLYCLGTGTVGTVSGEERMKSRPLPGLLPSSLKSSHRQGAQLYICLFLLNFWYVLYFFAKVRKKLCVRPFLRFPFKNAKKGWNRLKKFNFYKNRSRVFVKEFSKFVRKRLLLTLFFSYFKGIQTDKNSFRKKIIIADWPPLLPGVRVYLCERGEGEGVGGVVAELPAGEWMLREQGIRPLQQPSGYTYNT